jgi:hypothetical protein
VFKREEKKIHLMETAFSFPILYYGTNFLGKLDNIAPSVFVIQAFRSLALDIYMEFNFSFIYYFGGNNEAQFFICSPSYLCIHTFSIYILC